MYSPLVKWLQVFPGGASTTLSRSHKGCCNYFSSANAETGWIRFRNLFHLSSAPLSHQNTSQVNEMQFCPDREKAVSWNLLIPPRFSTTGPKQHTGKCVEHETVKLPWACQWCSWESIWSHKEGPRYVGAIAQVLDMGSGPCCVMVMQKSRCDLVLLQLLGTHGTSVLPVYCLQGSCSQVSSVPALGQYCLLLCYIRAYPIVLLWYTTEVKILCCR